MKRLLALTVSLFASACLLSVGVACGGDDDDDDDSSSSSYTCCVNGAFYVCPSSEAMQQCESACTRTASRDNECTM